MGIMQNFELLLESKQITRKLMQNWHIQIREKQSVKLPRCIVQNKRNPMFVFPVYTVVLPSRATGTQIMPFFFSYSYEK